MENVFTIKRTYAGKKKVIKLSNREVQSICKQVIVNRIKENIYETLADMIHEEEGTRASERLDLPSPSGLTRRSEVLREMLENPENYINDVLYVIGESDLLQECMLGCIHRALSDISYVILWGNDKNKPQLNKEDTMKILQDLLPWTIEWKKPEPLF